MAQKPFSQCKFIHTKRGCKHGCTREWKICHFWHQGKCWNQDNAWCHQGYHSKQRRTHNERFDSDSKDTRQDTSAGKRRADDRRVRSPREDRETRSTWHRSAEYSRGASGPTDAAQTEMQKKKWPVHQRKWLDLHIYLIRLGFYNIPHDETLPHPIEIENAYRNAMEEELPQEEKQRKDEAFEQIMRAINGHDLDQECESED